MTITLFYTSRGRKETHMELFQLFSPSRQPQDFIVNDKDGIGASSMGVLDSPMG